MENRISSGAHAAAGRSREMVSEHPMSATMVAFGIGFGVGIVLGCTLRESMEPDRGFAERLGNQILASIKGVVPENLSSRMHR